MKRVNAFDYAKLGEDKFIQVYTWYLFFKKRVNRKADLSIYYGEYDQPIKAFIRIPPERQTVVTGKTFNPLT